MNMLRLGEAAVVEWLLLSCLALLAAAAAGKDWGVGGAKFKNCASRPMVMYWLGQNREPIHSGVVGPNGAQTGFQVYNGHEFFWAEENADPPVPTTYPGAVGAELYVTKSVRMYYYYDDSTTKEVRDDLDDELDYMAQYFAEHGIHYVGTTYPRPPPIHKFLQASKTGELLPVDLSADAKAGQYTCSQKDVASCVSGKRVNSYVSKNTIDSINIEVVSLKPKVFKVENFLSEFEADYIINQAMPLLHRSTVGDGDNVKIDTTRTSSSAWMPRSHSEVIDSIYRRVGHMIQYSQEEMYDSHVEQLNVLNYPKGAEYTPHFDWGADGQIESRFISALIYLNTPEKGGGTQFPLADLGNGTKGVTIDAVKRTLVFFYDLLEDGNADELSLHAGLPVGEGEKWIAPMWIWDPNRYKGDYSRKNIAPRDTQRPPKRYGVKAN